MLPTEVGAVIATVYEPPTLGPLVASLERQGVVVEVVKGRTTNAAWNEGLARIDSRGLRYAIVCNDDIKVTPELWVDRLLVHHRAGYTWVAPSLQRYLDNRQINTPDGNEPQPPGAVLSSAEPADKGHVFSMDRTIAVPPVPEDMVVYFGDDWFYWHHRNKGRCCLCFDVGVLTGWDIGGKHMSGFTTQHPDLPAFLGRTILEQGRLDSDRAPLHFETEKVAVGRVYRCLGIKE